MTSQAILAETNRPADAGGQRIIPRWQRAALVALALGGLAGFVGLFVDRTEFWRAYLFAWLFCVEIGLGGLGLVLLHRVTGGRWSASVRPIAESAALTLPWLGLLFLPLLLGLSTLYPWADSGQVAASELLQQKSVWLNVPFFVARTLLYFAVWIGLAFGLRRLSTQDADGEGAGRGLGAVGMILYVVTTTFAAFDWMMSLEPAWFSSIYGLQFLAGAAVAGISLAVIGLAAGSPPSLPLSGGGAVSPSNDPHFESGDTLSSNDSHSEGAKTSAPSPEWGGQGWGIQTFNDLGNLLLAAVMIWAYFAFSQFLIIWSANIPEEAVWYVHRSRGGWQWVAMGLVVLHFALPFALLLSRSLKRNARVLAWLAGLLFCARALDVYWLIVPAFHPDGAFFHWLYPLLLLGMAGGWLALFVREWQKDTPPGH
ncbi:MAG: hypothetical protein WAU10_25505 [Caldilineaceae bacterium]